MPREPLQTLSEPMYYVLLALVNKCCGVDIMKQVNDISGGRVIVGSGTLYAMLDKFQKSKVIREIACNGRKRTYIITDYGKELLISEYHRLQILSSDGKKILEGAL